jgi:hypothetical protein
MRLAPKLIAKSGSSREFLRRADKIAGDLNVVLFIFMVGLATLDFTFLLTQKVVEALPPATRIVHDQSDSIFNQQQPPAAQPTK